MSQSDQPSTSRRRGSIILALVVVGLLAALSVALWLNRGSDRSALAPASNSAAQQTASVESTEEATVQNTPEPTADPAQEQLESDLPDEVGGYEPELTVDPEATEEGAEAGVSGVFEGGDKSLAFASSDWPSPEAALEYVRAQAATEFSEAELLKTGEVGQPARGQYWYYERDGGDGAIFWTEDSRAFIVKGPPNAVQEFFLRFPEG